jgi:succinate-acetate transporter protein
VTGATDGTGARIALRPIANPLPLGFLALAVGTLVLSGLQLEWIEPSEQRQVALGVLAFVAPLQLLASILSFLARDVGAATGMGILAGTWAAIGLDWTSSASTQSDALGTLLLGAAAALLVPAATAARTKVIPAAVMGTASVRFALSGISDLGAPHAWTIAAGVVGLALFALGVYAAYALADEDARGGTRLPLLRRGAGLTAAEDGLRHLGREAGVRRQL